ncbi:MAG: hypothetical protein KAT62_00830 [Desulfuromonadales bacterium]|nr:hypothetical protein [Desulfuromonadales bacterium]
MSIYPDWIEIDMGTGATTVVDMLEVELVDDIIDVELESAIEIEMVDEKIEVEVC